jgi:aerobic-type carbon monoxide dehydrogenase small subunit (CoxS/CutS family)
MDAAVRSPFFTAREFAMAEYTLNINGKAMRVTAPPDEPLLWVLRYRLDMTGTKYGCGEGQCGACTVLMDGESVHSCRLPVAKAAGAKITTVEGLEQDGKLTPVQEAFLRESAMQCGYCTSGMVMRATALLREDSAPSEDRIREAMNRNVCRCGTYPRIVAAVRLASQLTAKGGNA